MRKCRCNNRLSFSMFSVVILLLILALFNVSTFAQTTGNIKGKVITAKGAKITEVIVVARQNDKDIKTVVTDSKGEFVLDNLETGSYNIVLEKYGYASATIYNIKVQKNKTFNFGNKLILTVDKGTQVIIEGSVFDKDGKSIPNAKIEINYLSTDGVAQKIGDGFTNESGEFAFRFPESTGIYIIRASIKGNSASKEIEVNNATVYRLALTLPASNKP